MPVANHKWEPYAVSVHVAAEMVCKSRYTLYREIKAGRLPAVRPHKNADYSIVVEDLLKWVRGEFADGQQARPDDAA